MSEAIARLSLDASSFNKNADQAMKQFIKSTSDIRDAGDLARKGFEAIEKTIIKSFAGGAVITAAGVLLNEHIKIDAAMRQLGETAEAVLQKGGMAIGFEEALSASQQFSSAINAAQKQINEINSNPISMLVGSLNGATKTAEQLKESLTGLSSIELLSGIRAGNQSAEKMLSLSPEGQQAESDRVNAEKMRRQLQSSDAFRNADSGMREKIMAEFDKKLLLDQAMRTQRQEAKDAAEFQKTKKDLQKKLADYQQQFTEQMLDRDLADARRARESERDSSEMLASAQENLAKLLQDRAKEEQIKQKDTATTRAAAQQELSSGLLGSSRGGQQASAAAQKSRGVQVSRENFQFQNQVFGDMAAAEGNRPGLGFTRQDMRKRVVAEEAARANPSMLDKARAAGLGMDASEYAGQKARFKASLGNAASGFSSQEIDSKFRNKLQKDAAQQKQGGATGGGLEKLLQDVLNKLTAAPVISV